MQTDPRLTIHMNATQSGEWNRLRGLPRRGGTSVGMKELVDDLQDAALAGLQATFGPYAHVVVTKTGQGVAQYPLPLQLGELNAQLLEFVERCGKHLDGEEKDMIGRLRHRIGELADGHDGD